MTTVGGGAVAGGTAPINAASSSYGGGGVGGKFRKKPFGGRQSTPYDRPSTAIRPNRNNNVNSGSWLTKLVLDPATKLISYGADRFFSSIFRRKQLPPPSAAVEDDVNGGVKDVVSNNQIREQEPAGGPYNPPIDVPSSDSISELEQLLKQKTFTRPQIIHLTELLRSRAKEASSRGDDAKETTEIKLASDSFEENRTNGLRSVAVSTPILKSKVVDDSIASPAELAKSYMGSMPSKVSPSSLVMRSQTVREVSGLLGNTPSASKSSNLSLSKKMFGGLDAPENGFITPRSRSRSAVYNMAHTPYSRVYSASTLKGSGVVSNGYAGSLLKPASPYLVEHEEKIERHTSLKRRNTVLDDGVGSIGPIRRIRQKPNLLAPRIYHASHGNSDVKQKGQLTGETMHDIEGTIKANENQSGPSTSYARVPSKSSEVAARIFQQLEKLSPDKKSSQSKIVATREKSLLELKQSMLSGQALSSMENAESMKIRFDVKDGHELPDSPDVRVTDAIGSSSKNQENEVKNVIRGSVTYSDALNCGMNNAAVSLKASGPSFIADTVRAPQHLPKKNAFTISAATEKTELVKLNGPTEEKPASFKISETGGPGTATAAITSSESFMQPPSAASSGKLKEANNAPPLFSFSSTGADKFSSLPSEYEEKRESKQDDSNRLLNVPASISTLEMPSESGKADHFKSVTARNDTAKSENMHPVQSNGPQFAKPLFGSLAAASSSDTNQALVGSGFSFTSSASGASFVPSITSTAASSSASIFGSASSTSGTLFRFGTPVDQTTAVSAAQLTNVSENLERKVDGSSSASLSTFATSAPTSSGSGIPALFSSFSNSAAGNVQSSLFSNAPKSPVVSSIGTSSQGASGFSADDTGKAIVEKGPSKSLLTFGMSSSASSDATKVSSSSNSTPALFSFSSNPSTSSTTIVGSSSVTTPSMFGFGGNSSVSSSPANTSSALISGTSGIFNISTSSAPSSALGSTAASLSPSSVFSFAVSSTAPSASSTISTSSHSIGFSIGASSTSSTYPNTFTSSSSTGLSFGASSTAVAHPNTSTSSSSTGLSFGASPTPISYPNTFTSSSSTGLSFGASSTPIAYPNAVTSSSFTGFSFGASSSTPIASTNISPALFTSSTGTASSNSMFPLTTTSASTSSTQPLFGSSSVSGFGASHGNNNDQMNGEDTMAEDPVQATPPSFPVFDQTSASTGFSFGSTAPSQSNPFVFGGQQQNQATQQNPSPFQGSGGVPFNAGGSFSLGSGGGGGDKSSRKIVKVNRLRNRKK